MKSEDKGVWARGAARLRGLVRRWGAGAADWVLDFPWAAGLARRMYLGWTPGPRILQLSLTQDCNMDCAYCYVNRSQPQTPSFETLRSRIDAARALGTRVLVFTGGEPFLHPRFEDLLGHAAGMGLEIEILTNGTLLDGAWVERLGRLSRETPVAVTFKYSANRETYRLHTGVDCFESVCRAMRACAQAGLNVFAFVVLTRHEYPHLEATLRESQALGAQPIFQRYIPVRSAQVNRGLELTPQEHQQAMFVIRDWYDRQSPGGYRYLSARLRGSVCACYRDMLVVTAEGEILPCPAAPAALSLGNVDTVPLARAWVACRRRGREWLRLSATCASCSLSDRCGGGCLTHKMLASGAFGGDDPLCPAAGRVSTVEGLSAPCRRRETELGGR